MDELERKVVTLAVEEMLKALDHMCKFNLKNMKEPPESPGHFVIDAAVSLHGAWMMAFNKVKQDSKTVDIKFKFKSETDVN